MKRYRTFWPRLWAGFIDGLIFLPLTFADEYFLSPDRTRSTLLIWAAISYSAFWIYSVLMHARYGQTIGKMITGVRVLDLSEDRLPSLRQALLRDLPWILTALAALIYLFVLVLRGGYAEDSELTGFSGTVIASAEGVWFLLELISMVTNEKRRALHDLLARTVVLRTREAAAAAVGTARSIKAAQGPIR